MKNLVNKYFIKKKASIRNALSFLNISPHKCLLVIDNKKKLLGTITDGDIRKTILKNPNLDRSIDEIYNKNPIKVYNSQIDKEEIKKILKINKFEIIPIVNDKEIVVDIFSWDQFFELTKNVSAYSNIDIVIMAGGRGTRLAPFTDKFPKALMPIGGKPMISRILEKYYMQGFSNFYISIFYQKTILKKMITKEFNNNNLKIQFISEEKPLGTIGAVANMNIKNYSDPLIITNCDTIISHNIDDILNCHLKNKADMTLVITEKSFASSYGEVIINKQNALLNLKEKPLFNLLVNVGFYIVNKNVLRLIPKNKFFDATDLILKAKFKKMKIMTHKISSNSWIEIGKMSELDSLNQIIKN
jgi:dTDP-glucose pyrophosphorylase